MGKVLALHDVDLVTFLQKTKHCLIRMLSCKDSHARLGRAARQKAYLKWIPIIITTVSYLHFYGHGILLSCADVINVYSTVCKLYPQAFQLKPPNVHLLIPKITM